MKVQGENISDILSKSMRIAAEQEPFDLANGQ